MSGLQEAFYIIGIIFMSLMLLLIIAMVAAVFIIKSKIDKIHDTIEHKINIITNLAGAGSKLTSAAGAVARKAKRAVKK